MFYRTDDPLADFARHDAEQCEAEKKLPKCDYCNKPITDDFLFDFNGDIICERCLNDNFKKPVDDYIE